MRNILMKLSSLDPTLQKREKQTTNHLAMSETHPSDIPSTRKRVMMLLKRSPGAKHTRNKYAYKQIILIRKPCK